MYIEIFENYTEKFKFILPFILAEVIFQDFYFNMGFNNYGFINKERLIQILFYFTIGMLFTNFLMLILKNIINKEHINIEKDFKESIEFYPKCVKLNVIMFIVTIFIMLLDGLLKFTPLTICLTIVYNTLLDPCISYLIYYNASVIDALKNGIILGKKYFAKILLINLIINIISYTNVNLESSIQYSFINYIKISVEVYQAMFLMYLCNRRKYYENKKI